jgi:Transposase DNA-binding
MGSITLPTESWAESQFGECDFGDVRRTRRAVRFAAQQHSCIESSKRPKASKYNSAIISHRSTSWEARSCRFARVTVRRPARR